MILVASDRNPANAVALVQIPGFSELQKFDFLFFTDRESDVENILHFGDNFMPFEVLEMDLIRPLRLRHDFSVRIFEFFQRCEVG